MWVSNQGRQHLILQGLLLKPLVTWPVPQSWQNIHLKKNYLPPLLWYWRTAKFEDLSAVLIERSTGMLHRSEWWILTDASMEDHEGQRNPLWLIDSEDERATFFRIILNICHSKLRTFPEGGRVCFWNSLTRKFVNCIPHQILSGLSDKGVRRRWNL